jgi:hypothetical protein
MHSLGFIAARSSLDISKSYFYISDIVYYKSLYLFYKMKLNERTPLSSKERAAKLGLTSNRFFEN